MTDKSTRAHDDDLRRKCLEAYDHGEDRWGSKYPPAEPNKRVGGLQGLIRAGSYSVTKTLVLDACFDHGLTSTST